MSIEKNLEIGGQRQLSGWTNLGFRDNKFNIILHEIPCDNEYLDMIYWSHVIEHIPPCFIDKILKKMYNKLRKGGCLRTVCPDLKEIVDAYINKDINKFNTYTWGSSPQYYKDMGVGGHFISKICTTHLYSPEDDENLLFSGEKKQIGSLSHIGGYDEDMLRIILKRAGFTKVERSDVGNMEPHKGKGQLCMNAYK